MKCETNKSPAGLTTIAAREDEELLVVEDRRAELERIDISFRDHEIRVYSDKPWPVESFKRNGTPISTDNPLVAVTMCFRDGAVLRQGFKDAIPQPKAMAALGRFVAEIGGKLDIEPE
jgi:hypothetical protein